MIKLFILLGMLSWDGYGARVKDLANIRGVRNNQLNGYGIVVGLSGTGDKSFELTKNSLKLVLKDLGVDQNLDQFDTKNAAAVVVSAVLPAFAQMGSQLDVTVSSVGTASSLDGGTLLMTPLKGPDGKIYVMAQGKIVTVKRGGSQKSSTGQSMVTASIPGGGLVEREVNFNFTDLKEVDYQLLSPDFTTAARMAHKINGELGGKYATAVNAGTVHVIFPYTHFGSPVEVIAQVENVEVQAARKAKVVINQRTGTVVLGAEVQVLPVAVAHNNLKVEVRAPASAEGGEGESKENKVMMVPAGTTVSEIVSTLNDMGAGADDLVALIGALKASGALMAEVELQ